MVALPFYSGALTHCKLCMEEGFNPLPQALVLAKEINVFGRLFSLCWIEKASAMQEITV